MFIFFSVPLLFCLVAFPLVIVFIYVSVYSVYFAKAIDLMHVSDLFLFSCFFLASSRKRVFFTFSVSLWCGKVFLSFNQWILTKGQCHLPKKKLFLLCHFTAGAGNNVLYSRSLRTTFILINCHCFTTRLRYFKWKSIKCNRFGN